MGDRSSIEWTQSTWNPVTGCSKVSPGCAHCYAETISLRFGRSVGPWTPANAAENVVLHPDRLGQPLRWRRPRMVFVNSMSDLFHEQIPDEYIARVFTVMAQAEQHTFQILTKRPERMREIVGRLGWSGYQHPDGPKNRPIWYARLNDEIVDADPLPNVWLGVSIENRRFVDRADVLRATPAAVRFISAEPLLGPLIYDDPDVGCFWADSETWADPRPELVLDDIDWLIIGGESGHGARALDIEWAYRLLDRCQFTGTAPFVKQLGARWARDNGATSRKGGDPAEWPEDLRVREMPRQAVPA
jgi:protein gp37